MSEAQPRRKLTIENGADLFGALRSPNLGTRLSAVQLYVGFGRESWLEEMLLA